MNVQKCKAYINQHRLKEARKRFNRLVMQGTFYTNDWISKDQLDFILRNKPLKCVNCEQYRAQIEQLRSLVKDLTYTLETQHSKAKEALRRYKDSAESQMDQFKALMDIFRANFPEQFAEFQNIVTEYETSKKNSNT